MPIHPVHGVYMSMKAAVVENAGLQVVQEREVPSLPDDGAIIRVTGCGICGSDLDKLLHRNLPDGTVLGHEVVGVIETLSQQAKGAVPHLSTGMRVSVAHHVPCQTCYYCRHGSPSMCRTFKATNIVPGGFCQYIAVSGQHLAHTVFSLPSHVSDREASCIEPLACCLRAIDRLPQDVGESIFIVGLGFIGLLTAQYAALKGLSTWGVDIVPERVDFAQAHGWVDHVFSQATEALAHLQEKTCGRGADVVFLPVVNAKTVNLALKAVRDGGTLLLFASSATPEPLIPQNQLYFREIGIVTSYSPSLQHLRLAYDLIDQGQIHVEQLVTHTYPIEALPEAMAAYRDGKALKVFITL